VGFCRSYSIVCCWFCIGTLGRVQVGFWRRFWIEYCWFLKVHWGENRWGFVVVGEFYTAVSL
jgi:hypothetical protein